MNFLTKHKWAVTAWAAALGAGLVVLAMPVQSAWGQGVLVNVGTSLLLLAPLFYLNRVLEEKVSGLSESLRRDIGDLEDIDDSVPSASQRGPLFDGQLSGPGKEDRAAQITRGEMRDLTLGGVWGRTVALATMLDRPDLVDSDLVQRAVFKSERGNEQYYALMVARRTWKDLPRSDRDDIVDCIEGGSRAGRHIRNDPARLAIADDILVLAGRGAIVA